MYSPVSALKNLLDQPHDDSRRSVPACRRQRRDATSVKWARPAWLVIAALALGGSVGAFRALAAEKPPRGVATRYAEGIAAFRHARFPEAYGRFIEMADLGYAPAARHALWMCENGHELLGAQFDCAPTDIEAWSRLAGTSAREALQRIHPGYPGSSAASPARR